MAENKNKYALVTGSTSGIGYEITRLLAKDSYNLVLVARSEERLKEVKAELAEYSIEVVTIVKDLFEPLAAQEIYNEVKDRGIHIDVLVNDAGQGEHGRFNEVPLSRHLEIIQLNISSLVSLTWLFMNDMLAMKRGRILQLASIVSKVPTPYLAVYAATKAFVLSFSQALAEELDKSGVSITALLPGTTETDFFGKAHMMDTKEYQDKELADPADVAKDGYEALMSGDNRVISGAGNKMMIWMMNMKPDSSNAETMKENMEPAETTEEERKKVAQHAASAKERADIGEKTGDRHTKGL